MVQCSRCGKEFTPKLRIGGGRTRAKYCPKCRGREKRQSKCRWCHNCILINGRSTKIYCSAECARAYRQVVKHLGTNLLDPEYSTEVMKLRALGKNYVLKDSVLNRYRLGDKN